jgi:hypothetical protein
MLNQIGSIVASATLIAVGTPTLSVTVPLRNEPKLDTNNVSSKQEQIFIVSNWFNHSVPTISNLNKPNSYFRYCFWRGCW